VLVDRPIHPTISTRGFSHELGECVISFFATEESEKNLQGDFSNCLDGAPLLLPGSGSQRGFGIDQWLDTLRLYPRAMAEFDDSAAIKAFGQEGSGFLLSPLRLRRRWNGSTK